MAQAVIVKDDESRFENDEWNLKWETGATTWEYPHPREMIVKNYDVFTEFGKLKTILVPLCGNAPEMKWFYDKGHNVTGIDCSYLACEKYFKTHNLDYTVEACSDIPGLYKIIRSQDKRLTLIHGDLFQLSSQHLGTFDAILDWNSIVAIKPSEMHNYINLMLSCLNPNGRILLNSYEYPKEDYGGPPCAIFEDEIRKLYEDKMKVELLERSNSISERFNKRFGISSSVIVTYLVTKL